jgi:hypothetical protein
MAVAMYIGWMSVLAPTEPQNEAGAHRVHFKGAHSLDGREHAERGEALDAVRAQGAVVAAGRHHHLGLHHVGVHAALLLPRGARTQSGTGLHHRQSSR